MGPAIITPLLRLERGFLAVESQGPVRLMAPDWQIGQEVIDIACAMRSLTDLGPPRALKSAYERMHRPRRPSH